MKKNILLIACLLLPNSVFVIPLEADTTSPLLEELTSPTSTVSVEGSSSANETSQNPSSEWSMESSPLSAATSTGRSLYVSTTGSDAGDGSQENPWQSIQYAVSQLQAGDTLFINEGAYSEDVDFSSSGAADALITIQGVGNVVLDGTNLPSYESGFDTKGHDYIRFVNLTTNHFRAGIDVRPGSQFIEIDGLRADGNSYAVRIEDGENITVKNAYAINSSSAFRALGASHDLIFENIQAYNSVDPNSNPNYVNGDGVIIEPDVYKVLISNSIFGNNGDAGIDTKGNQVIIDRVEAFGNKNNFKTWGETTIQNSLSHHAKRQLLPDGRNIEGNGITVETPVAPGTATTVINSTFVDNEDHEIRVYLGGSLRLENSIVARRDPNGMLFANNGSFTSDRVLWYAEGLDFSVINLSLTDFRANPRFVDWTAGNYRLKDISLAINYVRSTDALSVFDLDGNARVFGPWADLGAYEFQGTPVSAFKGVANGDTVNGTIFVGPDRDTFPSLRNVTYYLNGQRYTSKSSPYTLGGSGGFDTKKLSDGTYVLRAVFQISKKTKKEYSVAFTVNNSLPAATDSPSSSSPSESSQDFPFTGIGNDETVSGRIFVKPKLDSLPPVNRVIYYVTGENASRTNTEKNESFQWGGGGGFDTGSLPDGTYTLKTVVRTSEGDLEFTILFHILN